MLKKINLPPTLNSNFSKSSEFSFKTHSFKFNSFIETNDNKEPSQLFLLETKYLTSKFFIEVIYNFKVIMIYNLPKLVHNLQK